MLKGVRGYEMTKKKKNLERRHNKETQVTKTQKRFWERYLS